MPTVCTQPGCPAIVERGYCQAHADQAPQRPGPRQRGYTGEFERNRDMLLSSHPECTVPGCTNEATVAHHEPTRRQLVAQGVRNPDAREHLRARCKACHARDSGSGR